MSKFSKDTVLAEQTDDIVNEPQHYARWKIEPITYILQNGFEFWRGNIVKYASRAGYKSYEGMTQKQSEITDLEKVKRYCDMRINQLNEEIKSTAHVQDTSSTMVRLWRRVRSLTLGN